MEQLGGCYGFAVRSAVPLRHLRPGADPDWPPLEVAVGADEPGPASSPVLTWAPSASHPVAAEVHRVDGGYAVHVDGGGWFSVRDRPARVAVPAGGEPLRREERLWGVPALLAFQGRGDLPLHAAAVEVGGRAVVFGGLSGAGKTTLATAAAAAGLRLLSEDLTCVRLAPAPAVLPGPAALRVRRDVADLVDLPAGSVHDVGDDRLHILLDEQDRGTAAEVPLAAVVLLRPGAEVELAACPATTAVRDLWALSFRLPETAARTRAFDQLTRLVDAVPAYDLRRPLRVDALPATLAALRRAAGA